jgi:hypothetical protein
MKQHIASLDCWCRPRRDPGDPSVIIHNDYLSLPSGPASVVNVDRPWPAYAPVNPK